LIFNVIGNEGHLDKLEALAVLKEILDILSESVMIESISLDDLDFRIIKTAEGYRIRMKCDLDSFSRDSIKPLLEKHSLTMTEEKGYISICKTMH
jgi:hypothetical protein